MVAGVLFIAKTPSAAKWLICRSGSGHYLSSMITFLLHLLRLLPFFFGGHRQLAIENLAFAPPTLRLQANDDPAQASDDGQALLGWPG